MSRWIRNNFLPLYKRIEDALHLRFDLFLAPRKTVLEVYADWAETHDSRTRLAALKRSVGFVEKLDRFVQWPRVHIRGPRFNLSDRIAHFAARHLTGGHILKIKYRFALFWRGAWGN